MTKIGRKAKRSPAAQRYRSELRIQKNKRLNIEAAEKQRKEDRQKYLEKPRGYARAVRRALKVGNTPYWDLKAAFL